MYTYKKKYVPDSLNKTDKKKQKQMLAKSRNLYRKGHYYTRKPVSSYHSKPSKHVLKARRIYGLERIAPSLALAKKSGCSVKALRQIVKKGEGAYYSSGSRPNQTPQSWGLARLASAVTGGKASKVDYAILENGCDHSKTAMRMAKH